MKTYFLFGLDAVEEFEDNGTKGLLEQYEDNEIGYEVFVFDTDNTSPIDLLSAYNGMSDYCVLTEEEYNLLIN